MSKKSIFPSKVTQVVEDERLTEVGLGPVGQIQSRKENW
jgi:hypothetical protein